MNKVVGGDLPAAIWRDFVSRTGSATGRKAAPAVAQSPPGAVPAQPRTPQETVLRGIPQVLDTGTLGIRGRTVRLQGIAGEVVAPRASSTNSFATERSSASLPE